MKLIDRYLLSEWLKILALTAGATLGLLLLEDMYNSFRDLLDAGAGVGQILQYYAVLTPSLLSVVLPISMLVSLLYALGQLHRNHEFTALRAAGLSFFRIMLVVWCGGVVLSGLSWYLSARVIPWSVEASRTLKENLQFVSQVREAGEEQAGLIRAVAFDNQRQGRMWFINRFSEYSYRAFGATVSELDRRRRETTRIMAEEAYYDDVSQRWVFLNGREMWFDPQSGELQRSRPFERAEFAHIQEDPELMLLMGKRPKDLSFFELQRVVETYSVEENPKVIAYAVRLHLLIAGALSPLIVVAIAIPFAVSGVRVNPAVGVSKSIGLFFGYYLLASASTLLGERGLLDPVLAAWIPNLLMLGLAGWLLRRVL